MILGLKTDGVSNQHLMHTWSRQCTTERCASFSSAPAFDPSLRSRTIGWPGSLNHSSARSYCLVIHSKTHFFAPSAGPEVTSERRAGQVWARLSCPLPRPVLRPRTDLCRGRIQPTSEYGRKGEDSVATRRWEGRQGYWDGDQASWPRCVYICSGPSICNIHMC